MSAEESCSSCAVIRVNYFDVPILLCPEVKEQSKRGLRLLCSGCECVAPTVQCSWMGTTNRMIEIFNLTLNSRASRDEMQTKRPFGESDMDYRILLLVYRDTGNRSTVWYPPAGCVWCYGVLFFFFLLTLKNIWWLWSMFLSLTLFKELTSYILVLQPPESLSVALPAVQRVTRDCMRFRLWIPVA